MVLHWKTLRFIRDWEKGVWSWGKRKIIYLLLHCHHQNDSCMSSDESHFNVSLTVRDKVTRRCPQTTTFLKRKESRSGIEPRSFRLQAYRLTAGPNWLSTTCVLRSLFCRQLYGTASQRCLSRCLTSTETIWLIRNVSQRRTLIYL